jgi:hypothetical protein
MPSRRQARSLPCPATTLPPRSVRIGTLKLKVLMLSAICRICYRASAAMSPAYPLSADRAAYHARTLARKPGLLGLSRLTAIECPDWRSRTTARDVIRR